MAGVPALNNGQAIDMIVFLYRLRNQVGCGSQGQQKEGNEFPDHSMKGTGITIIFK